MMGERIGTKLFERAVRPRETRRARFGIAPSAASLSRSDQSAASRPIRITRGRSAGEAFLSAESLDSTGAAGFGGGDVRSPPVCRQAVNEASASEKERAAIRPRIDCDRAQLILRHDTQRICAQSSRRESVLTFAVSVALIVLFGWFG